MYITEAPARQQAFLVLCSGGLDSAVTLALAHANLKPGGRIYTLAFDYGQRHVRELESSMALALHYHAIPHVRTIEALSKYHGLRKADDVVEASLTGYQLMPTTWKPARNIVMLALAAAEMWTYDLNIVAGGWHQEDYPGYPDCRMIFLAEMEQAMASGTAHPIRIWAPILYKTKTQIVKLGLELGVPFEKTWSCYAGGAAPCHECDACVRREAAFLNNMMKDPLQ